MFTREEYSENLITEMLPLFIEHHEEIRGLKNVPIDPNFRMYEDCAKAGILRIYTVRVGPNLCGYQVFMVMNHPHSKHSLQANQDILFLTRRARLGFAGYRFIKWCGEQLKAEGVKVIHQHISARNDFGRLLERMGYHLEDLVYAMEVN